MPPKPVSFKTPADLRAWFEKHHTTETELIMRLYRVSAADHGITYQQALDEALCFGWIDGVRRSYDEISYTQRFTPRKARSVWSNVNIRHAERLIREGRMTKAGLEAFKRREPDRTGNYSFETRPSEFPSAYRDLFMKKKRAWAFFEQQPPGYRRLAIHWVVSAKKEETRLKRLSQLIERSARGERFA
jgi:uncharacterized protein YdeI (YjbR/CyaY-like superfamily)